MNSVRLIDTDSGNASTPARCPQSWQGFRSAVLIPAILLVCLLPLQRAGAQIDVDTTVQGVTAGHCSLQEAIYATEFGAPIALDQTDPDDTYNTGCTDPTSNWNTIVLQRLTYSFDHLWDGDAHNPFGPTATPIIFKTITIRGNGATLQWTGSGYSRLFAIGQASISPTSGVLTSGTYSGTGNLALEGVYVKNFKVKGGDGVGGGGGGLGAGGAIYMGKVSSGTPGLTVMNSTFDGNSATGGNGGAGSLGGFITSVDGGGGGGLGGNGGAGDPHNFGFGGGGGARGNGPYGGGGTAFDGSTSGGYLCGGDGANGSSGIDGSNAPCPGGGGGAGMYNEFGILAQNGDGGAGAYGGGGGAGMGSGGNGGFGGGGGSGNEGSGGDGGFGGGGAAGLDQAVTFSRPGHGGAFGGNADDFNGGGGGALGGAIFNDRGTVVVQNSTFFNNYVDRGTHGGDTSADNGADAGGAIFSRNGSLTVQDVTISGNQATGSGAGIVVMNDGSTPSFVLQNTIVAGNGAQECMTKGSVETTGSVGNLIVNNSGCAGVAVTTDPNLQPLALNPPGLTPTMALTAGSPAVGAADVNTSLSTDQRSVVRKSNPDIGAYELVPEADLSLSKSVSTTTAKSGDTITYTLTITNSGPDTADSVTLTDNLPAEVTFVSCAATGSGQCATAGAVIATTYSSMPSGDVETVTIKATVDYALPRGTVVTNKATVLTASMLDPNPTNNSAQASFTVIVPDFSLGAVSPISIAVGGSGTSSVTVTSLDGFSSPVSLTASGPSGFSDSFSPTPVTPPTNASIGSTLTVKLGPSVTAGSSTVNVTGTSGALSHPLAISVAVKTSITAVANVITTDQTLTCIDNSGIATALTSKLSAAQTAQSAGQTQVEINTLKALEYQLYAQGGKHIKTSCLDGTGTAFNADAVLISDVSDLLATAGGAPDPILGNVVDATGAGISGVTVSIVNSSKTVIAGAMTDGSGFYYFPSVGGLNLGANYTIRVSIPKGFKSATPSVQGFTWQGMPLMMTNFALN